MPTDIEILRSTDHEYTWCSACGTPSVMCPICEMGDCTGGCKHFDYFEALEPAEWPIDGFTIHREVSYGADRTDEEVEAMRIEFNNQIDFFNSYKKERLNLTEWLSVGEYIERFEIDWPLNSLEALKANSDLHLKLFRYIPSDMRRKEDISDRVVPIDGLSERFVYTYPITLIAAYLHPTYFEND